MVEFMDEGDFTMATVMKKLQKRDHMKEAFEIFVNQLQQAKGRRLQAAEDAGLVFGPSGYVGVAVHVFTKSLIEEEDKLFTRAVADAAEGHYERKMEYLGDQLLQLLMSDASLKWLDNPDKRANYH